MFFPPAFPKDRTSTVPLISFLNSDSKAALERLTLGTRSLLLFGFYASTPSNVLALFVNMTLVRTFVRIESSFAATDIEGYQQMRAIVPFASRGDLCVWCVCVSNKVSVENFNQAAYFAETNPTL